MRTSIEFSDNVPAFTKIGIAELFHLLEDRKDSGLRELMEKSGVNRVEGKYALQGESDENVMSFLQDAADWYTRTHLAVTRNYDVRVLEADGNYRVLAMPRPATIPIVQKVTTASNIGYKNTASDDDGMFTLEALPGTTRDEVMEALKTGYVQGESYPGLKGSKLPRKKTAGGKVEAVHRDERVVKIKALQEITKKKSLPCGFCGRVSPYRDPSGLQYPLIKGPDQYSNFYSFHAGTIPVCPSCTIANHFALGRLLYASTAEWCFIAIPEANSIQDIDRFLRVLDKAYESPTLLRRIEQDERDANEDEDKDQYIPPRLTRREVYESNFMSKTFQRSGFYFLILNLFSALKDGADALAEEHELHGDLIESLGSAMYRDSIEPNLITRDVFEEVLLLRSWSFILYEGDREVRAWRYQTTPRIFRFLKQLEQELPDIDLLRFAKGLTYKSGNTWLHEWREDFCRGILEGSPAIRTLEMFAWSRFNAEQKPAYRLFDVAKALVKTSPGGGILKEEDVLRQCQHIGIRVAEIAKSTNKKSILYELRSIGNAQMLRSFLEKLTFAAAMDGNPTGLNQEFIREIADGENWKELKSMIAIVANQNYGKG